MANPDDYPFTFVEIDRDTYADFDWDSVRAGKVEWGGKKVLGPAYKWTSTTRKGRFFLMTEK